MVDASVNLKPFAKTRSPLYEVVDRRTPLTYKLPVIVEVAFGVFIAMMPLLFIWKAGVSPVLEATAKSGTDVPAAAGPWTDKTAKGVVDPMPTNGPVARAPEPLAVP